MRSRVRVITAGAAGAAAVGAIALTVALSAQADAGTPAQGDPGVDPGRIAVPPTVGDSSGGSLVGSGTDGAADGSGGQLAPAPQQPQSGGGRSQAGSGGS